MTLNFDLFPEFVAVQTFNSRLKRSLETSRRCFVLVSHSHHWVDSARRWLALFAARKVRTAFSGEIIIVGDPAAWEHREIECIEESEFKKRAMPDDLVLFSVSHHCPKSAEIEAQFRYRTFDMTAYTIDPKKVDYVYSPEDYEAIRAASFLFDDPLSQGVFSNVLHARIAGNLTQIQYPKYRIYAHPAFAASGYRLGSYIDGGAYNGKESEHFLSVAPIGSEVIGFEFDSRNYNRFLREKLGPIQYINAGLWSVSGRASVSGGGLGSRVSFDLGGESSERLVALDEFLDKSKTLALLKMDIEGAEVEALKGASNLIRRDKPLLAISIYHRPRDLWEIPLLVREIREDYRFYIGQHDKVLTETVLYAT